jgi:ribosomal protein L11 methyltransferase
MSWLEVSMIVNGELAEAVAEVLARYAPNGVMTEQGVAFINDEDEGTGVGPVTVRAYLPVNARLEETRQNLEKSLYFLGRIQPLPAPGYRQIPDQNWMEAWKQHYRPIPIGKQLIIVPVWLVSPEPERIPIKIDPGMAFGTGTHPTTQMSLALIERCFSEGGLPTKNQGESPVHQSPSSVIDIGCGSGILSIAAVKLGAQCVLGVDIDAQSITNARENAERNGVGEEFCIAQASVKEVLEGNYALRRAALVVANILAPVILRLFDSGLAELVEPGGCLILSGILQEQTRQIIEAAQAQSLVLNVQEQMGDWVALAFLAKSKLRDA